MSGRKMQRMSPTIWALFLAYCTLAWFIVTDFQPVTPRKPVVEGPYDAHRELSNSPKEISLPNGREMLLYMSKRMEGNKEKARPLVIFLAAGHATPMLSFWNETEWGVLADRRSFTLAILQSKGHKKDKWLGDFGFNPKNNVEELAFMRFALLEISQRVALDYSKVFVVGVREGAGFSLALASTFPKLFAGVWAFSPKEGALGGRVPPSLGLEEGPVMRLMAPVNGEYNKVANDYQKQLGGLGYKITMVTEARGKMVLDPIYNQATESEAWIFIRKIARPSGKHLNSQSEMEEYLKSVTLK